MKKLIALLIPGFLAFASCQLSRPTTSVPEEIIEEDFGDISGENEETTTTDEKEVPVEKEIIGVRFESSNQLEPLLAMAGEKNKPLFLDFYASWCAPCRLMDQRVFTDPGIAGYLNDNFINFKVDADAVYGKDLAVLYSVTSIPTLIFLDSKGRILVRKEGAAFHTELRNLGDQALELLASGD